MGAQGAALFRSDMSLARMLGAFGGALFARDLAFGAVRKHLGVRRAGSSAGAADVRADGAQVAVVDRTPRQRIHRRGANVGAIEVDQGAERGARPDIGRRADLAGADRFLAGRDAGLKVMHFTVEHDDHLKITLIGFPLPK